MFGAIIVKVRFWGVRGSLPTPIQSEEMEAKIRAALLKATADDVATPENVDRFLSGLSPAERGTFGGNTACVSVENDQDVLALDAGSGLRVLGQSLMKSGRAFAERPFAILLSHFHWDHIMGFPFFGPAFVPGNRVVFYSAADDARHHFYVQQNDPYFPVSLDLLGAELEFNQAPLEEPFACGSFTVSALKLNHPDGSIGYRVEAGDAAIVYMTDTEIETTPVGELEEIGRFAEGADLVVVDAQYTILQTIEKVAWGHSTIYRFIDLLHDRGVRRVAMFHHDPQTTDDEIIEELGGGRAYLNATYPEAGIELTAAYEGWEIDLP